jgi:hypothetical protein
MWVSFEYSDEYWRCIKGVKDDFAHELLISCLFDWLISFFDYNRKLTI